MTTTSTFQGMDENQKPSSRVLAPPGGGSSNIFGGYEDNEKKNARSSAQNVNKADNDIFGTRDQIATGTSPGKKHNPNNVNCGNNDIFNRETHATAPQQKSRAPRSGDDSFSNLFGDASYDGYAGGKEVSGGYRTRNQDQEGARVDISQSQMSQPRSSDSFANVFGDGGAKNLATPESKLRQNNREDSFSNVFNHLKSHNVSSPLTPVTSKSSSSSRPSQSQLLYNNNNNEGTAMNALHNRLDDMSLGGGDGCVEDDHDINSSFSRVLGQFQANVTPRSNRFPGRGEFNPITGMAYEQPAQKEEAPEAEKYKEETVQGAGAAAEATPQQGSGIFRGPESTAKPHASTRVSQPPGGRSTKLW